MSIEIISPTFMLSAAGGMFVLLMITLATNVRFLRQRIIPDVFRAFGAITATAAVGLAMVAALGPIEDPVVRNQSNWFFVICFAGAAIYFGWKLLLIISFMASAAGEFDDSASSVSERIKARLRKRREQ